MRNFFTMQGKLLLCAALALGFSACNDDVDYNDAQAPEVALLEAVQLYSQPEREFHIIATITDDVGIASIRMAIPEWSLDKTISLRRDTLVTRYELDYRFKTPADADLSKVFSIAISVTDVAGKVTDVVQRVNPNGDFDAPALDAPMSDTITVLMKANTTLNLDFTVNDNKALAYVVVQGNDANLNDSIIPDGKSYSYAKIIALPTAAAVYSFRIAAMDTMGNLMESLFAVQVADMPDFKNLYLTDFLTKEELNKHLIATALAKRTGPYTYEIGYYAKAENTGVYFIPQKTDLQPICFGVDPAAEPGTIATELSTSQPITFSDGVGYYKITIKTLERTYSVEKYTPTTRTPASHNAAFKAKEGLDLQFGIAGAGLPDLKSDQPADAIPLLTDPNNPYILYKEVDMEDDVWMTITAKDSWDVHECGCYWGWGYRWTDDNGKEQQLPSWRIRSEGDAGPDGSNGHWTVSPRTKYRFELDAHLNYARILKVGN